MKYILKIRLDKPEFKLDYRRTIISFFKKSISEYQGGMYYDEIYNSGAVKKSLVWSIGFGKAKFNNNIIKLVDCNLEITLKISDPETALIYYSSLLEMKGKAFPLENGNHMELQSIKMVREPKINDELVIFKIRSPICLKKHVDRTNRDWYVSIGDSEFALELEKKLLEDLPYMKDKINELKFNFDGLRKIIISSYGIKIPVTIGEFIIQGNTEILNHILKNGIGSKRNSGFGLVEAIVQKEVM